MPGKAQSRKAQTWHPLEEKFGENDGVPFGPEIWPPAQLVLNVGRASRRASIFREPSQSCALPHRRPPTLVCITIDHHNRPRCPSLRSLQGWAYQKQKKDTKSHGVANGEPTFAQNAKDGLPSSRRDLLDPIQKPLHIYRASLWQLLTASLAQDRNRSPRPCSLRSPLLLGRLRLPERIVAIDIYNCRIPFDLATSVSVHLQSRQILDRSTSRSEAPRRLKFLMHVDR